MSLFIGNNSDGNTILHITKNQHNVQELKSGVLSDTIFHNDMPMYSFTIYPVTNTRIVPDYVEGPVTGNNWPVLRNNPRINIKLLEISSECATAISNSYALSNYSSIMYLDSNYSQVSIDSGSIAFVKYSEDITTWRPDENYGITYCPIPEYNDHRQPCLFQDLGTDISYICVFTPPTQLISGYGARIAPNSNIFTVGNTNFLNFKYVSLGNVNSHSSTKHINSKMGLVDTSLIGGRGGVFMGGTENKLTLNNYVLFSDTSSLFGTQNIATNYINLPYYYSNYQNTLAVSGVSAGDLVYIKCNFNTYSYSPGESNIYNGFFIYSEGSSVIVRKDIYDTTWRYCSGGNVYFRTYRSPYMPISSTYASTILYSIFK